MSESGPKVLGLKDTAIQRMTTTHDFQEIGHVSRVLPRLDDLEEGVDVVRLDRRAARRDDARLGRADAQPRRLLDHVVDVLEGDEQLLARLATTAATATSQSVRLSELAINERGSLAEAEESILFVPVHALEPRVEA